MRIKFKLTTRVRRSVVERRTESGLVLMRLALKFWVPLVRNFLFVAQLNSYKRGVNFLTRRRVGRRGSKTFLRWKAIAWRDRRWFRERLTGMMWECVVGGIVLAGRLEHLKATWGAGARVMVEDRFHCFTRDDSRITLGPIDLVGAMTFIAFIISSSIRSLHIAASYLSKTLFTEAILMFVNLFDLAMRTKSD